MKFALVVDPNTESDIQDYNDIQKVRNEWLDEGADWFDDEEDVKPINWNVQVAKPILKGLWRVLTQINAGGGVNPLTRCHPL